MLNEIQYERNDQAFARGRFRVRGDTLEVMPAYEELAIRIQWWGDEIERISEVDPLTGEILRVMEYVEVYPARHIVTSREKLELAIADIHAALEQRLAGREMKA